MPSILAFPQAIQSTSVPIIQTPFDQLTPAGVIQSTPQSVQQVVTNPTFGGITSLTPQLNGSLLAAWSAASSPNLPLIYDVYIQLGTSTGLFVDANRVQSTFSLQEPIFNLKDGTLLVYGSLYYVGVRARDPLGNVSTSTTSMSATSSGVAPGRPLAPDDIPTVVAAVWNELQAGYTGAGSFGNLLDSKESETKTVVDTIATKLGNPVGSTFSADYQSIQSGVNTTNTRLGTPVGASLSADIAAVKSQADVLVSRLTAARAGYLDFLDVAISSRQSSAVALSQFSSMTSDVAAVFAAVQAIQNNTTFVGIVPPALVPPPSGNLDYKFFANLFNTAGLPKDPDSNEMYYKIDTTAGVSYVSQTLMTRTGTGAYEAVHSVAFDDDELELVVTFTYVDDGVTFVQRRLTRQTLTENQLDTILARLTQQRADNLDFLDALISSRLSNADDITRYNNLLGEHDTTQTAIAAVSTKLGTPVSGSVSADVAAVRVQTDKIGSPVTTVAGDLAAIKADTGGLRTDYTGTRAAKLDNLDVAVSTRESETNALSRFTTLNNNDVAILAGNSARLVGTLPQILERPSTGSIVYAIFASTFDVDGAFDDPDSNIVNYRIEDSDSNVIVPTTAMTRIGIGQYQTTYSVSSAHDLGQLIVFFEFEELTVPNQYIYTTTVSASDTKLDGISDDIEEIRVDVDDIATKTNRINTEFVAVLTSAELSGTIEDDTEVAGTIEP